MDNGIRRKIILMLGFPLLVVSFLMGWLVYSVTEKRRERPLILVAGHSCSYLALQEWQAKADPDHG